MVARALAMAHTCMYDAWAAHDARAVGTRLGGDLRRHHREQRRAHKETAISVAAYRAAVDLFPAAASGVFDPLMLGSGSSAVALPPEIRQRLASALDEKARAEAYLASSGMTYTIIRPGGLKSEPPTGRGALTRDPRISGTIHRAEVAELIYACLVSDRTDNMTLSAVDRDMVRDHLAFEPFALESIG